MGLFGGSKVYVSSVMYSLGEEDTTKIPDLVKASIVSAGFQGTSRARAIDRAIFDGMGVKLTQGYHYAKNHYYAGLPTGFPAVSSETNDPQLSLIVKEYLAGLYPSPANTVVVNSVVVTTGNNYDTRLHQLLEVDYSYDFYNERVHTANNGIAVEAVLDYEELPADAALHPNDLGWKLTFTNPNNTTVVINKWYPETNFLNQEDIKNRIVIEYTLNSAPAVTMYYEYGGADARLNIFLRTLETGQSGTFPAMVLKKALTNKVAVYLNSNQFTGSSWQNSAAYKTTKAYARRLDVDIDSIMATLEDNPDENQIDYAFIQPGTKISSTTQAACEYHYRYFERLFNSFPSNKAAYDAWVAAHANKSVKKSTATSCPFQKIHIRDLDDTTNSINMIISWRYITKGTKTGTLPTPYTITCGAQEFLSSAYANGKELKDVSQDVTKLYIRKRLTSTTYSEIVVCGLWHENYIYKTKSVDSSVWASFNDPDGDFGSGFLLPLEYDVLAALSGRERLQLAQEALHLVLNCYKVVKQKWYQTGIFKVILAVVGIVLIVLSWGSLTEMVVTVYEAVLAAIGTAIASVTIAAAVAATITALIFIAAATAISFVAREAGEWAAEQWGPAWGAVVTIVTTLAMSWAIGAGFENLNVTIPPATLPMTVLNVTNAMLAGLATFTTAEFQALREAQSQWNDYIASPENPMKELERLMDEWFPENSLQTIAQEALFGPKETLDQFLGRTLTMVDGLTYRLTLPITHFTELTLTPRLL